MERLKLILWHLRSKSYSNVVPQNTCMILTLLHSEWPKLHRVLAGLSANGFKRRSKIIPISKPCLMWGSDFITTVFYQISLSYLVVPWPTFQS